MSKETKRKIIFIKSAEKQTKRDEKHITRLRLKENQKKSKKVREKWQNPKSLLRHTKVGWSKTYSCQPVLQCGLTGTKVQNIVKNKVVTA